MKNKQKLNKNNKPLFLETQNTFKKIINIFKNTLFKTIVYIYPISAFWTLPS